MGCDIHLYIEILTENGWELYSHPSVKQDYELFAKMAGVRNYTEIKPISLPKGLPEDISYVVRRASEDWGSDGHSHSWLCSDEIRQLREWYDGWRYDPDGKPLWCQKTLHHHALHCYCEGGYFDDVEEDRHPWIKAARFVFWFDN